MKKIFLFLAVFFCGVSINALPAHLAHGDCIGPCDNSNLRLNSNIAPDDIAPGEIILSVFPNPFSNVTKIEFTTGEDEEISIEAYNYTGQLIRQLYFGKAGAGKKSKVMFDAQGLSKGIYFIKAQTTGEVCIIKLILM
jgi:hypothetical protein